MDIEQWADLEKLLETAAAHQKPSRAKIIANIFSSAVKLAKESPGTLNLKITSTVLKELRYSFKIFYPFRFTPKITMFGSARVPANTPLYEMAKEFGREAVARGFMVITGGGPGIMAGGNEGANNEGGFGLNIRLPVEQSANPFIDKEKKLLHYKYFFTRKLFLVKEASAFVFFPGGFGTLDEAFEVMTLLQTGKTTLIPVVLLETPGFGFWKSFLQFFSGLLGNGFVSESDRHLFHITSSTKDALNHIQHFYSNFHSMRHVKEKLVIRIKKPLSPTAFEKIQKEFSDLSGGEPFTLGGELPEESNEPELKSLGRISFPFDHRDYGRLRLLVDELNAIMR